MGAPLRQLDLGKVTVDRIVEVDPMWMDADWFYRNLEGGMLLRHSSWLGKRLIEPEKRLLAISHHSYLLRVNGLNILVDTCNGNHKQRPTMLWQHDLKLDSYLNGLSERGLSPDDIDVVMCTHLHTDHVGWNTRLKDGAWVPTFRNARYIFSRSEFEHHVSRQRESPNTPVGHGSFQDSVLPVVDAGLVELVDNDFSLFHDLEDSVRLEHAPGHTPGHVFINLQGTNAAAVITGDAIHHPIQLREHELINVGDYEPVLARRTRTSLLERCCGDGTIMLTGHFPSPTACRVIYENGQYDFRYI